MGFRQPYFIKDNIYFQLEYYNELFSNSDNIIDTNTTKQNIIECECGHILTILNLQNNYCICPKCKKEYWHTELNKNNNMENFLELQRKHKIIMDTKNILISVYTNASGFLWQIMKVDSGTDLGWSDFNGDCKLSGTFTTYEKALEDAINLIEKCDLEQFRRECPSNKFHWGNYADWISRYYR